MTIQEEKKKAISDIESDQERLLAEIIAISKKLPKKSVNAAIASAIDMVTIGMQIRMLEAQKQVIMSQPMPKRPWPGPTGLDIVRVDGRN